MKRRTFLKNLGLAASFPFLGHAALAAPSNTGASTSALPGPLSWDSARARHVNWVRLRDRATHRQFRVVNTHPDHKAQQAREKQMQMILDEAATCAPEFPQILTGDFNSTRSNPVLKLALDAGWSDTHEMAPEPKDDGNSTHAFLGNKNPKSEAARKRGPIDFILTRGPFATLDWKIIRTPVTGTARATTISFQPGSS